MKDMSWRRWTWKLMPLLVVCCVIASLDARERYGPDLQLEPPSKWSVQPTKLQNVKVPGIKSAGFAVVPGQWAGAALWSAWGDAVYASDGSFYFSIGDHHAPHGHAMIFKLDPRTQIIKMVVDLTRELGIRDVKHYAPGKVHGPLVDGGDGWLYFAGYRGALKYTTDKEGYDGDHLLRYSLNTGKVEDLGIPVPEVSHPYYRLHKPTMRLYGVGQPGMDIGGNKAPEQLYVYDLNQRKLLFNGGLEFNSPRSLILTDDGRAYFSTTTADGKNVMAKYDPKTNKTSLTSAIIPRSGRMRASTRVDRNGIAYALTYDAGILFAFDTKKDSIESLGDVATWLSPAEKKTAKGKYAYTSVIKLDPTERYLYAVPRSHGGAESIGTPLVRFDLRKKKAEDVTRLFEPLTRQAGYAPMGSFGTALSDDGSQMLIVWNGCYADWKTNEKHKLSFALSERKAYMFDTCAVTLLQLK